MERGVGLAAAVCVLLAAQQAAAEEQRVVVLMPRELPSATWPEGTRAVVAELSASRYDVVVESSSAHELGALIDELRAAANAEDNAGAISVVRDHGAGVAYVWTRRDESVVRVQSDATEGAVSEGALALRVLELFRARALQLPREPKPRKTASPPPPPRPASPAEAATKSPAESRVEFWLGFGPTFAGGAPGPLLDGALGARVGLLSPLALEATGALSVTPLEIETNAGAVNVSARRATLHLMGDVWRSSRVRVAFGAGGGAIWVAETASPASGYQGHADHAYLGLASLRASATLESGALAFGLRFEPGLTLPRASIRSSGEELAHLGNTWASLTASIGWSP